MKNLEIKIQINSFDAIIKFLKPYYIEDLYQTDTYFTVNDGRMKLRKEVDKEAYMIYYQRPDLSSEKYSNYSIYPIQDVEMFYKVFSKVLHQELVVKKKRSLYIIENARIHLDVVENLGNFLEIEIVINNTVEEKEAPFFMDSLLKIFNLKEHQKIDCGYRELLLRSNNKTLDYYIESNKIFWVVNKDLNPFIKSNDITPCIFVEKTIDNRYLILQLSELIKFDTYKYTAWRKFIGETYNINVEVLLINNHKLYTLDNKEIEFSELGRSNITVDRKYLAPFSNKN